MRIIKDYEARLAEAAALLRENCGDAPMPLGWYERVCAFLAAKESERE